MTMTETGVSDQGAAGGEGTGPNWRALEAKAAAAEARAAELETRVGTLRGQLVSQAVQLAGFKPGDDGAYTGPVPLLVREFEATIGDGIPTAEAFTALAGQYGITPPQAVTTTEEQSATPSLAEQIAATQAAGNTVIQNASPATPQPPKSIDDQIAEAEAAGNHLLVTSLMQKRAYDGATTAVTTP